MARAKRKSKKKSNKLLKTVILLALFVGLWFIYQQPGVRQRINDFLRPNKTAQNNRTCIELLLDAGADILHHDKQGVSPLLFSFMNFNDITQRTRDCASDWEERCRRHEELTRLLVSRGADVNSTDKRGITPLMLASGKDIEYLHSEKACPVAFDRNGKTVVMYHLNNTGALRLLRKYGADLTARDIGGNDLLLMAPIQYETIKDFVNVFGFSVNTRNKFGTTPLHRACYESNLPVVKFLIRHGADPDAKDERGKTPEDIIDDKCSYDPDDCDILDYFSEIRRKRSFHN